MYRKMGMREDQRRAALRNMTTSLLKEERIKTTATRASEVQRLADHMITLGKRGDLHARRQAAAYLLDDAVVQKLFDEIAPKYKDRSGGYTRILKIGFRRGDGAPLALIELV
jgi:large subunit ribosomal protein L17